MSRTSKMQSFPPISDQRREQRVPPRVSLEAGVKHFRGNLASRSGSFRIGGVTAVHRLGFGTMRLTGPGIWGEPEDRDRAIAVLRRAVDLGINLFDTADSYGPDVAERLIAEALHPYPAGMVIATKGGLVRPGPGRWVEDARPEHLREACEGSLRRLKVDCIDLYQLHRIDAKVDLEDQIGALLDLQRQGKIRHIGLSEVSVAQIQAVQRLAPVGRSPEPLQPHRPWF